MIRHLVIHITILTGFVWCSDQPYSDYRHCTKTDASHCYANSVFKSWRMIDINMYHNAEDICHDKIENIKFIDCTNTVTQRCLPDDRTKDLFPTAEAEEKGFLHICSRPEAMNGTCLSLSDLGDCQKKEMAKIGKLSIDATFEQWKENQCRHFTINYECARNSRILKEGCPEARSMFLEYTNITYPKACGDLSSTPNGQPSIFTPLLSFSQLILFLIMIFV